MQTALHIYALVEELKETLLNGKLIASEFYKKEREAYLFFKVKKGTVALGLAYHPTGFGAFVIPRSKIFVKTREKPWPFFQPVLNSEVVSIKQLGLDRIIRINLQNNSDKHSIIVEAIGPNGNLWLLESDNKILATLRNKKYETDIEYTPPTPLDRLNPFDFKSEQLIELIEENSLEIGSFLNKNFLGLNKILANEIAERADLDYLMSINEISETEIDRLTRSVLSTAKLFEQYGPAYSYETAVAPFKLHHLSGEPNKFKTLSLAVYDKIKNRKAVGAEISGKQKVIEAVKKYTKKQKRKIGYVEKDISTAGKFDMYRQYAELLKANLTTIKKGQKSVRLDNLYDKDSDQITITLNPAMSVAENADSYFKKYRKGKDGLGLLERRLEIAKIEYETAEKMLDEFEDDFDSAEKKYENEIIEILPVSETKRAQAPRLPYRSFVLASGVTIFVGKDGADNDTTTFRHARPYELWFHVSQCPGSHVVLKFPNKKFQPSKNEIAATAAAAAFYSKARKSKTVPVIYTEKKYVRKPRKAKAGLVTVEREIMVMVEPKKPE
ncbi:MAG: fibronectin-binding domain-containing protein [candidate division Zixibacteria bacterium]|nr:fibronectin-binding domain-containing protein [candidate division Zixibacteria bacterium]